ncbi:MAG: hypothetical protein IPG02_04605 [Ignavibacteria bacterium]|nr:hypothetical protein [Ignavibacteria bacterium]MBK6878888.1 hypothetical protein [Ignavibacteria bacterium]MBK9225740.1 hypothetical protein [Ignavibacteria bacterium]
MSRIIKKNTKAVVDDKKELLIDDLVDVIEKLGFEVRIEKGTFKGGFCLLREQKVFLINKNLEQDKKINILARNISDIGAEGIYLKPNVRELVEKEELDF